MVCVAMVTGQSCVPNCTDYNAGERIPDPKNCRQFYTCLLDGEPSDVSFPCDEGFIFDWNVRDCLDETDPTVVCELCMPTCQFQCPGDGEGTVVADLTYCNKYYVCGTSPDPIPVVCDMGYYFDGGVCQEDPDLCCNSCLAFCYEAFTEVADPTDCTKFYFCREKLSYPLADDIRQCPEGEIFNPPKGHCVAEEGTECHQPCQD
ncbi:hypothetical protein Pcinc_023067 [Petrolisthes cinctipes]|uniref:Chitin-binding type-2 domain-containing protein n=1 Tax=Petrolisthes cinctipes TaxID=88211 RepID=A0AAE1FGE4_PETCI|nr:hypothetical protein Pcinc_023067 [Petrolisthes cinctipes]